MIASDLNSKGFNHNKSKLFMVCLSKKHIYYVISYYSHILLTPRTQSHGLCSVTSSPLLK